MNVVDQEKKIIRMSMIVLSLALIVIYILLYYVKGKNLIEGLDKNIVKNTISTGNEIRVVVKTGNNEELIVKNNNSQTNVNTGNTMNGNTLTGKTNAGNTNYTKTGFGFTNQINTGNIKLLSGTSINYKTLESIDKLGIRYKYILSDDKNIYYIALGTGKLMYDFSDIAKKLGGSLYEIKTEQEIIKNKLFGDKVTYINIPEYKNKLVLMLVEINKENWIIQVNYNSYYKSKVYLQGLFQ